MVSTKPRKYRVDIATVIIVVLAVIAIILAAGRYCMAKSQVEDLEVIEPIPPIIPEETVAPIVEPVTEPEIEYISLGEFRITAYCACKKCCGVWADSRPLDRSGNPIVYGASGNRLLAGYSIAVDPDVIPYGTKVYIDGREYIAHDTGGAIDGNRIDFYMGSHEDALAWGVRYREVFVVKEAIA